MLPYSPVFRSLCILLLLSFTGNGFSQNFKIVRDVNSIKNASPEAGNNTGDTGYASFTKYNNIAYFNADDGIHGREIWRSDGTAGGTYLFKDLFPGKGEGVPSGFTVWKNKLWFIATDSTGKSLWSSDGTVTGTLPVVKLNNASADKLMATDTLLYFITNGYVLWRSDGTADGTFLLKDFSKLSYNGVAGISGMVNSYGRLYLKAKTADINSFQDFVRLYTSDGTVAGTKVVDNDAVDVDQVTVTTNGVLYFTARLVSGNRRTFWISNAEFGNAYQEDFSSDFNVSQSAPRLYRNKEIFYIANDTSVAGSLFRLDVSAASTPIRVKQFNALPKGSIITALFNTGNAILISINTSAGNKGQLWLSNGSTVGTKLLKDNCYPVSYAQTNESIYFAGSGNQNDAGIWQTDLTESGTVLLKGNFAGNNNALKYLTGVGDPGRLIFTATDSSGTQFWKTEGTTQTTTIVKPINQTTSMSSGAFSFVTLGERLYFGAYANADGVAGKTSLWRTGIDGADADSIPDVSPVAILASGNFYGNGRLGSFAPLNNSIFFNGVDNKTGRKGLFRYDDLTGKLTLLKDTGNVTFRWIVPTENFVYFAFQGNDNGNLCSLFRTDGTAEGTIMLESGLRDIYFQNYRRGQVPVAIDSVLYFVQNKAGGNDELWRTDGSVSGTQKLQEVEFMNNSLCTFKDSLFYTSGFNLYKTGGLPNTAVLIKENLSDIRNLVVSSNQLYFSAASANPSENRGIKGNELWVTDGSANGTHPVKDIAPGNESSNPDYLIDGNGKLFFFANDLVHGNELWKTDGTDTGTVLVKDITTGVQGTQVVEHANHDALATAVNGRLLLSLVNTLWESDGTENGTHAVADVILKDMRYVAFLVSAGGKLFFQGQSYQYGLEEFGGSIEPILLPKYEFNGRGNADNSQNWLNGIKPPSDIPGGVEVVINPEKDKPCILNVPLHIKGGKLTINKGAKVIVQGQVLVH